MLSLREQLEQVKNPNIKKPLTPLQKLQASNRRRRKEIEKKLSDLQDRKSLRAIGGMFAQQYTGGFGRMAASKLDPGNVGAKIMNTNRQRLATRIKGKYIDPRKELWK